jgi:hypothetical protein
MLAFIMDEIINIFSKNIRNITPIGYYFSAEK